MNAHVQIAITAGLVATACGLLGPFLVLRRAALMGDAVSHAVLPGIVAVYLVFHSRAPVPVVIGAGLFAIVCVLLTDAIRASGLVKGDAAIGLVFPMLFSLGVLGVTAFASNVHLDLDSTIYGEIAFTPFRTTDLFGFAVPTAALVVGAVAVVNLALVVALWKEIKVTTFDPEFAKTIGRSPSLLSRILLVATAITAVSAFESVGAILVVTMLIVPAATAYLLTDRLLVMVVLTVAIGWLSALAGQWTAVRMDASIAGAMGMVATACFVIALIVAPRYGLAGRWVRRRRARAAWASEGLVETEPNAGP